MENGTLFFNGFDMSRFDNLSAAEFRDAMENGVVPAIPGEPGYPGGTTDVPQLRQLNDDIVHFEVGPGIMMPVTMNGIDLIMFRTQSNDGSNEPIFRNAFSVLTEVYEGLNGNRALQPGEAGYPGSPGSRALLPFSPSYTSVSTLNALRKIGSLLPSFD